MQYYLGVDIGTTSAKAVAFSVTGEVLISCSYPYKMRHPQPSWSEQDPEEVFAAVTDSCNKIISSLKENPPKFIAFSAAMHSIMAIDRNGKPLTNCIIWADNRAAEIAEGLRDSEQGKCFYHKTGVPVHAMSPLCKLLWIKEHKPAIFKNAYKFIGIKEYVCHKFCREYLVDTSLASTTGLLNLETLEWDENILNFLDIPPSSLSRLVSPKHKATFSKVLDSGDASLIPQNTAIIIGGSDGALANLGTGSINGNSMVVSIGTSGAARIVAESPETDRQMRTFCYHLKDNLYIVGGASNNGAIVLEWVKDKLLESEESFSELFQKAEKIEPGSDDLLFIPYILGERAPIWNSKATGVFFGLNINHTKPHLVRASMEGVIYGLYSIAKILFENRVITEIHATGGFAQSSLWVQMLADVCNTKVLVKDAVESSALGAVMIGMEALSSEPFLREEILSSYQPNLLSHEVYMKSFEKFERIYQSIKNEFVAHDFVSVLS